MPFSSSYWVRLDSDFASPPSTGLVKANSWPQLAPSRKWRHQGQEENVNGAEGSTGVEKEDILM